MPWILASFALALLCYEIPTLITAVLVPLWHNPNALQTDFHYYYDAAVRFSNDPARLYSAADDVIAGFAYPPPAILPFVALSKLPLGPALLLMTVASYAAVIASMRVWCAYLRRQGATIAAALEIALTVIAVALAPTYMNAIFGQVNAFVLLSAVVFLTGVTASPIVAGTALALGALLKIYPAMLVTASAWLRGSWRAIGYAVLATAVLVAIALPIVPLSAYGTFLTEVIPARVDKTALHITNQSLVAFLERFRYASPLFLNWTGEEAVTVTGTVRAANILFAAAMVVLLWLRSRRDGYARAASSAALMAMIGVIAPLGWGHTYVMALPLILIHLVALRDARPMAAIAIPLCVLALMVPAGRHLPLDAAPDWLQNLMYSRYLIATITLILLPLDTRPQQA